MIGSLPLGFAQPLVLLGLLSLPVLWWLLRLVPPRPRRIDFPPTRLLFEIAPKDETPARTPWWLTLLRLTLAALVIIAAAGPMWNPPLATADRAGPLLILLDDAWPAASTWDARLRTADEMIVRAEADNRGVAVLPLSQTERDISLQIAGAARVQIKQITPKPYGIDRTEALPMIERFLAGAPNAEIVWLSDGVDLGKGPNFVEGLKRIIGSRPLTIVEGGLPISHALTAADNAAGALTVKVLRALEKVTGVHAVAPIIMFPVAESPGGLPFSLAPVVFGIDMRLLAFNARVAPLVVRTGQLIPDAQRAEVVVGSQVAHAYALSVGSTLTIRDHPFTVVGVLETTFTGPDSFVFMPFPLSTIDRITSCSFDTSSISILVGFP